MGKVRGRLVLDLALGIMLIFEMFYMLTGNTLHEIVGIAFFVTVIIHLALSHRWMRATRKVFREHKSLTAANAARVGLAIALGIVTILLAVSSLMISNLLFATGVDMAGDSYSLWASIHTVAAYVLCACVLAHVAVHWVSVVKALRLPYDPSRRQAINAGVTSAAAVGVVALGLAGAQALREPIAALAGEDVLGDDDALTGNSDEGYPQDEALPQSGNESGSQGGNHGADRYGGGGDRYVHSPDGSEETNGEERSERGEHEERRGYSEGGTDSNRSSGSDEKNNRGSGSDGNGNSDRDYGSGGNNGSGGSGSDNSGSSGSDGNSATGVCNLCRKRCSLSAPQCRRPYDAGLI